jgi:hypothetical protein
MQSTILRKLSLKSTTTQTAAVVILLAFLALTINFKPLHDGILYAAEDVWWHVIWIKEFTSELQEGIIYPRWLASSNFLHGSPHFAFYPPLCYYLGALIQFFFHLSAAHALNWLFALSAFLAGMTFYLLVKDRCGPLAAAAGASAFISAPYLTFDIYVRAALAEVFALVWLPLILLPVDSIDDRKSALILTVGFFLLALTHVPSLLIFTIAWATRVLYCFICTRRGAMRRLVKNILFATLGLSMASFFLLPILLERGLVDINAMFQSGTWVKSFVWSKDFSGDALIPDIVLMSTCLAVVLFIVVFMLNAASSKPFKHLGEPGYWLALNLFTFFLASEPSCLIWVYFPLLQDLQFPWRFTTVNCFATAVLFALSVRSVVRSSLKPYFKVLLAGLLLTIVARSLMSDFFMSKFRSGLDNPTPYMLNLNNSTNVDKFARFFMPKLLNGDEGYPGVPEYRPMIDYRKKKIPPPKPHHGEPPYTVLVGPGDVKIQSWKSYERVFLTDAPGLLEFRLRNYNYPGWRLYVDDQPHAIGQAPDGTMIVDLAAPGQHKVVLRYEETTGFRWGLAISFVSLLLAFDIFRRMKWN